MFWVDVLVGENSNGLVSIQFHSVTQSCLTLCDPMDCSMPGFPVHHQLLELAQTHVHWVSDTTELSHPLSSPSPPALNLSQHQSLFQWVSSSHQVAKVLEFQLQHQSFPMNIKWVGLVALKRKRKDSGLSEIESLRPRRDQNCWHSKLTDIFGF